MAVRERDYMKSQGEAAEGTPAARGWLDRLNDYGERHATAIIAVSTGLIILTVLIFAKYFYDKSQVERAEQDLSQAESIEQLTALKGKFGSTPVAPRIVFRLANKYYEEGKLDVARNEYKEFESRFPDDPLRKHVIRALNSLERNAAFETDQKEARLKEHRLISHPRQMTEIKDPRFQWGPVPAAAPVAEIELAGGKIKIELFEDDAPQAVASFIQLAEKNYFDGMKWEILNEGERAQLQAKADPAPHALAFEETKNAPEAGSLLMVRKEGAAENVGGRLQILLRALPELKDATVFGKVTDGLPVIQAVKKDDAIKTVKIVSKRAHPYEPKTLPK